MPAVTACMGCGSMLTPTSPVVSLASIGRRTMSSTITKYRVKVVYDEDTTNPRDDSDHWVGTLLTWHRRYNWSDECDDKVGDPFDTMIRLIQNKDKDFDPDDEKYDDDVNGHGVLRQEVQRLMEKYYVVVPVFMYEHSGISLSTEPFSCPWDSGQLGFIFADKADRLLENKATEWTDDLQKHTVGLLQSEIDILDQYVQGQVYGFICEETEEEDPGETGWKYSDECYGFYGDDPRSNGMEGHLPDFLMDTLIEASKNIGTWHYYEPKATND
jgi:hypothetical protein